MPMVGASTEHMVYECAVLPDIVQAESNVFFAQVHYL